MAEDFRCSDAARGRGDGIVGSAGTAVGWLLIEHPGPWAADLAATAPFTGAAGRTLAALATRRRVRPLLVRRHGRRTTESGPRSLLLVDQATRQARRGAWRHPEDVLAAIEWIGQPLPDPAPPVVLVCAHAKHDQCCAIRGRPVARALTDARPDLVWECTHLGGDRFAPNVLILPEGVMYAAGDADTATQVVDDHLSGRPTPDRMRGISGRPPAAQAALVEALRTHPGSGLDDHSVRDVTVVEQHLWRVRVRHRIPGVEQSTLLVRALPGPAHRLTCRAATDSTPMSYIVVHDGTQA